MPGRSGNEIGPRTGKLPGSGFAEGRRRGRVSGMLTTPRISAFLGGLAVVSVCAAALAEEPPASAAHRAFRPVAAPTVPDVRGPARTDVDRFILAALDAKGLAPGPEADRTTLVRRVAFDLTGLPPTVAEIDGFLADISPDAYERMVG